VSVIVLLAGAWARRPPTTPLESSAAAIVPGVPAGGAAKPETPEPETPSIPSTPRPLVATTSHAAGRGLRPAVARDAAVREPEVLVLPGQEEALRRFVAGLRDGSTPAPPLLLSGASVESLIAPAPLIEIPLLEASPLADSDDVQERSHS
jgi:hypothetical protein